MAGFASSLFIVMGFFPLYTRNTFKCAYPFFPVLFYLICLVTFLCLVASVVVWHNAIWRHLLEWSLAAQCFHIAKMSKLAIQSLVMVNIIIRSTNQTTEIQTMEIFFNPSAAEIKLGDIQERGFTSRTKPERGRIHIRGYNLFMGYYKDEKLT